MSISVGACQKFEIFVQKSEFLNNNKRFYDTNYDLTANFGLVCQTR